MARDLTSADAAVILEAAFDYVARIYNRASSMESSVGELDAVIQNARVCEAIVTTYLKAGAAPRDLDRLLERADTDLSGFVPDVEDAAHCPNGAEVLERLAFDFALVIATARSFRRRLLRQLAFAAQSPGTARRSESRQRPVRRSRAREATPRRRTRGTARSPGRLDDDDPHDHDVARRASERRAA